MEHDRRALWLVILAAIWVMVFAYAFYAYLEAPPEGHQARQAFLGWQAIAGLFSIAIWAIGRHWPRRTPMRRLTSVPILIAVLLAASIFALVFWGQL